MKLKITKKTTKFCLPISPEEKLAITLRLLVTGETYKSLIYQYQVPKCHIKICARSMRNYHRKFYGGAYISTRKMVVRGKGI